MCLTILWDWYLKGKDSFFSLYFLSLSIIFFYFILFFLHFNLHSVYIFVQHLVKGVSFQDLMWKPFYNALKKRDLNKIYVYCISESSSFQVLITYEICINLQIDILNLNQYIPKILHFTVVCFQL